MNRREVCSCRSVKTSFALNTEDFMNFENDLTDHVHNSRVPGNNIMNQKS